MAISINHATKVVSIPKDDTTYVSTNAATGYEIRSYDEYALMRELADYLDSEAGASLPVAFSHNTNVLISGVSYARTVSFLAPYTFTFENGSYQVKLTGGTNNNLLDALNPNSVSVIASNSAGLQSVATGAGPTAAQVASAVWMQVLEGSLTAEQIQRIMLAALAGTSQKDGNTITFKAVDGVTDRITGSFDAENNRTGAVLNGG